MYTKIKEITKAINRRRKLVIIVAVVMVAVILTIWTFITVLTPKKTPVRSNPTITQYEKSLPELKEKAIAKKSTTADRLAYGQALYVTGDKDEAEKQYSAVVAADQDNDQALVMLGNIKRDGGDYTGAQSLYKQAIEKNSTNQVAYTNLAHLQQYSLQKPKDAAATYKKAIAKFGQNTQLLFSLGVAYEAAGDKDQAAQTYRLILQQSPDYAPAKQGLERVK